ncbi:MAG: PDZ domain-containing protein [Pirellulales bacterium]|nr:PDZ domain-containing protein [Pirellulales bacterium]
MDISNFKFQIPIYNLIFAFCILLPLTAPAQDLPALEQQAFTAAVDRVAPSVVQIETVGGREQVEGMLFGSGPTSGLIVDPDGYIVSSAFGLSNQPASILVRLPDGTRKPAQSVAADHARMLVLLKIKSDRPLPVCEIAPQKGMRVGQWAIAIGRTFSPERPNFTVGILSALDRIWGKAIQTDAAVSPNNYGGPLVDIHGRVLGVLAPLSPESADELAGVEWYDSGIGFAVPAEHVLRILPRLKKGEDLRPGLAGFSLKAKNLYTGDAEIAACRPKTPAAEAGLKPGDVILEIDGRKISRAAEAKQQIARHYAGDVLDFVVLRGKDQLKKSVTLTDKLEPYQHPWLGILPRRDADTHGVAVRHVFPDGPAAKTQIRAGDVITSLNGQPVTNREELLDALASLSPGDEVEIEIRHAEKRPGMAIPGGKTEKRKLKLGFLPPPLPPKSLPPAHEPPAAKTDEDPPTGVVPLKVAEFANQANAYVPPGCRASIPHGVVLWLDGPGGDDWVELLKRWKPLCDAHDLIFVAPKPTDHGKWSPLELPYLRKLLLQIMDQYPADPLRIVVAGRGGGGRMAARLAFRTPALIPGLVLLDTSPTDTPPENDPRHRLSVYWATAKNSPSSWAAAQGIKELQQRKIPLTVKDLGEVPRPLTPAEWSDLARWIDALDRM